MWGKDGGASLVCALFDIAGEIRVNAPGRAICRHPVAAHMAGQLGGFAVAWIETDDPPPRVMLRRFSPDGEPFGPPVRVSDDAQPDASFAPAIARTPDTSAMVCWVSGGDVIHDKIFKGMARNADRNSG